MQVLKKLLCFVISLLCGLIGPLTAFASGNTAVQSGIIVNLPSRTLEYYESGSLFSQYRVAIGSAHSPTPLGTFHIIDKEMNPWWYPPGKDYSVPSGPANPLGYRWLGFLPTYGIHGTNMPWSIGRVVSNGCIRMLEQDVEELFDLVTYRTPVTITYDRIKVSVDDSGNASIGVYPDVYGYQDISVASAHKALNAKGLEGLADDAFLGKIIAEQTEQQIIFAQVYNLIVNGVRLNAHAAALDGDLYIPAPAVAAAISTKLTWDESTMTLQRKNHSVPGQLKGSTVYVSLNHISTLFGGKHTWQDLGRSLSLTIPVLFHNGQPLSSDVHTMNDRRFLPALPVAKALGIKLTYNEKQGTLRNCIRQIPVEMVDNQPYIDASKLGEYYNAAVNWNEDQQHLDLIIPDWGLDCSMYLDLMQDCLE